MRGTEVLEDNLTKLIGVILGRFEIKNCLDVGFDCLKGRVQELKIFVLINNKRPLDQFNRRLLFY